MKRFIVLTNGKCSIPWMVIAPHEGHYVPLECCSLTNPRTSGGVSEIDDIDLPCGADCGNNCDECIIQKIMDEYAEITQQVK